MEKSRRSIVSSVSLALSEGGWREGFLEASWSALLSEVQQSLTGVLKSLRNAPALVCLSWSVTDLAEGVQYKSGMDFTAQVPAPLLS